MTIQFWVRRIGGMMQNRVRGTAAVSMLALCGCVSGSLPELPKEADYARSCPDLIDAYIAADDDYRDSANASRAMDLSIAAAAAVAAAASSTGAGIPIVLGGFALSELKGDWGADKRELDRDTLHQVAVRNGCTSADVEQRKADLASEAATPAASN